MNHAVEINSATADFGAVILREEHVFPKPVHLDKDNAMEEVLEYAAQMVHGLITHPVGTLAVIPLRIHARSVILILQGVMDQHFKSVMI